jgi:long-chain acyl-CoA synthetase
VGLTEAGFAPGDRMGLYVQNDPAFVIGLLGAWKAGGAAVAINPMNKARELRHLLVDSGARALLCLDELYDAVARHLRPEQVVTLTAFAGLMIATNVFNNALRVDLDDYLLPFRKGARR